MRARIYRKDDGGLVVRTEAEIDGRRRRASAKVQGGPNARNELRQAVLDTGTELYERYISGRSPADLPGGEG